MITYPPYSLLTPSVATLREACRSSTRLDDLIKEDKSDVSDEFLQYKPFRSSHMYRRRRCSLLASMDSCRMETIIEEDDEE
ncbi:hypothetical protein BJV82DRAFT_617150 [Fennellomyces sp. T-0311]|nr:hypothetical protein BJV82DRAFT_617150 [Fennellomyces sp. T-0311]